MGPKLTGVMRDHDPTGPNAGDMPWNDVPADSDVVPGTEEPDPAEVSGSEDDPAASDATAHAAPDPTDKYRQDTLDQRLAEEVPDRPEHGRDPDVNVFDASEGDDVGAADPDDDDDNDRPSEEAAMHLTDKP